MLLDLFHPLLLLLLFVFTVCVSLHCYIYFFIIFYYTTIAGFHCCGLFMDGVGVIGLKVKPLQCECL